jgi:lipoate-protein ligase B
MHFIDWDLIDYEQSSRDQLALVEAVARGDDDTIVFCRHPSVVTLGRGFKPEDLTGWSGAICETSRGGRATYHGPSQIVIYPILNLAREHKNFKIRDLHGYMRTLEAVVCESLKAVGIQNAEARTVKSEGLSLTGVWVGTKKIASLGIAVRKSVTYHGVAINVGADPEAFRGINPCGFQRSVMTNVWEQTGSAEFEILKAALKDQIQKYFLRF